MTSYYEVKEAKFINFCSTKQGSSIYCLCLSINILIKECTFNNCSSTASLASPIRSDSTSGGACFLYSNYTEINSCYFNACKGRYLGAALYICSQLGYNADITCISDTNCGQSSSDATTVYGFECMSTNLRDLNSTRMNAKWYMGSLHFGQCPNTFTCKYASIISNNNENYLLGISLHGSTNYGYLSHMYFEGSSHNEGLFSCWEGSYEFDNIVFASCSGKIYSDQRKVVSVSFKNTIFDPSLSLSSITKDASCKTGSTKTHIAMNCAFLTTAKKIMTCYKRTNHNMIYPFFCAMLHSYEKMI